MIRLGIVGCNYGRTVLLPAFRADRRCAVVALAGSDGARAAELAREAGVANGFGSWEALVEHDEVEAVAIATPPGMQPRIALRALELGKPVFVEKPLAADLASAAAMLRRAKLSGRPAAIDFNFSQVAAFRRAREMLEAGAVGRLRHVMVTWNVENAATRLQLPSWKTDPHNGGAALGNFVSHSFHYLEWFCGPIGGLSARLSGPPARPEAETNVTLALAFASGASGSLAMSCASFLGSGHRVEFYGDDGTLVLANSTADYMRGFALLHGRRPATALAPISVEDTLDAGFADGRVAPVARLATGFLDAIEGGAPASPGFADGYRVQCLLDGARRSHVVDARSLLASVPMPGGTARHRRGLARGRGR
jgi:predicted dehydrogenase